MARPDSGRQTPSRAPVKDEDRRSTASYISALAAELRGMAHKAGLPTLAYLLDVVRLHADEEARESD